MSISPSVPILALACMVGVSACGGAGSDATPSIETAVASSSDDRVTVPATTSTTTRSPELAATTAPPSPALQLVEDAAVAVEAGDWNGAVTAATEAIELEPADEILAHAYLARGIAFGFLGELDRAADDATRALELGVPTSDEALALVVRANAYLGAGHFEEAVADATDAIDLEPDESVLAWAYATRGGAHNELGRREQAVADATIAIDLGDPMTLPQAYLNRSAAYRGLGQLDKALADATTAIDLGVDDVGMLVRLYLFRALAYGQLGRFDEAVADATSAIDLEPPPGALAQLYVLRAEAFAELDRLDDAAADLDLAIEASPYAEPEVQQMRDRYGIPDREPVDHGDNLAAGETIGLAQHLVAVEGYTYVDIATGELNRNLELIQEYETYVDDDLVVGASWHPVVADDPSQNTASDVEVGFLMLLQRNESTDHDLLVEHIRTFWLTGTPLEELDIGGVAVSVFENPDMPDSRYIYTWAIGDVTGVFDGADPGPLERWLTAYFDELTTDYE